MTLKSDIKSYFTYHPALDTLIDGRFYPHRPPQRPTLPCIAYFQVSIVPVYAHDNQVHFEKNRIQFDCIGRTPMEADLVADGVRRALNEMRSVNPNYTGYEERRQDFIDAELERYRVVLDAFINRSWI